MIPEGMPRRNRSAQDRRASRIRRAANAGAVAALVVYLLAGPLRSPAAFVRGNAIDFVAVYCGTAVAATGADPYRVEPLRSCQQRVSPRRNPSDAWIVVPAPLPPYSFLLLRPLAGLPFDLAKRVWVGLGVAALLIAAACVARITALPWAGALFALTPSLGLLNIYYGEPIPLAVASIGLAALCAFKRRDAAAGVFAALALLEPHVGLGACVGAFSALPRARIALVATGLALAAAGVAQLGFEHNVEYLATVLPAQARSEIGVNYQLGLTHVLSLAGVGDQPALLLGSLSYLVMLGLGAVAARAFAHRRGVPAAALYFPVTFTMLGGTYIHAPEIAAALPGALLLCSLLGGPALLAATVGSALLIVPWNAGASNVPDVPLALAAAFITTALLRAGRRGPLTGATLAAVALALYIRFIPPGSPISHARPATPSAIAASDLSSRDWAMYVRATHWMIDEDLRRMMLKAPQWLGLLLVIGSACAALPALMTEPAPGRLDRQSGASP